MKKEKTFFIVLLSVILIACHNSKSKEIPKLELANIIKSNIQISLQNDSLYKLATYQLSKNSQISGWFEKTVMLKKISSDAYEATRTILTKKRFITSLNISSIEKLLFQYKTAVSNLDPDITYFLTHTDYLFLEYDDWGQELSIEKQNKTPFSKERIQFIECYSINKILFIENMILMFCINKISEGVVQQPVCRNWGRRKYNRLLGTTHLQLTA